MNLKIYPQKYYLNKDLIFINQFICFPTTLPFYLPVLLQGARLASKRGVKGTLKINKPSSQQSPSQSASDRNEGSRSDRRTAKSDVQFKRYTHSPKMKTSGIASSASVEENCKTVSSKLKNEVQSEMIKPKKTKRLIKSVSNFTKTSNKFEQLEIEECIIVEKEIQKTNYQIKQKKKEKTEISNFKVN